MFDAILLLIGVLWTLKGIIDTLTKSKVGRDLYIGGFIIGFALGEIALTHF